MAHSAPLPAIKDDLVNHLLNSIHTKDFLDILLFQQSFLGDLELLIARDMLATPLKIGRTAVREAAAECLQDADQDESEILELKVHSLLYLILKFSLGYLDL